MPIDADERIENLTRFIGLLDKWNYTNSQSVRETINRTKVAVEREVIEAGCRKTFTIAPPASVGGMIMRDINSFDMIFESVYMHTFIQPVKDMINQTIGVLESRRNEPEEIKPQRNEPEIAFHVQAGYVFVAMPIGPANPYDDVLDAIKETCNRCGLTAERVDEAQSNERITDRILESIRKSEYMIVDLTESRPNVFYEAGYAQGIGKVPIYIAKSGTDLEFDLKDYPVIFFDSYRELKQHLETRLRGLADRKA